MKRKTWYFSCLYLPFFSGCTSLCIDSMAYILWFNKVRPNQYHVMRDIVGSLDFEVKFLSLICDFAVSGFTLVSRLNFFCFLLV